MIGKDTTFFNPIYARLTRDSKELSARAAVWIGIGAGVIGFLASLLPLFIYTETNADVFMATVIFGLSLIVAVLFQLWGLVLAAAITARYARMEDHALIALTNLTPAGILDGYRLGVTHYQRLLSAIGFWFLPAGVIGGAYEAGSSMVIIDCFSPDCGSLSPSYIMTGLFPALIILAIGMYLYSQMWHYTADIGIWLGLRWPGQAPVIAGAIAAFVLAMDIIIVAIPLIGSYGFVVFFYSAGYYGLLLCPGSILIEFALFLLLARYSRKDSERLLGSSIG